MNASPEVLLHVEGLKKYFPVRSGVLRRKVATVRAVDGVSFDLRKGETLGLVGESGCGKSTTGAAILRLEDATAGKVVFEGVDLYSLNKKELRDVRKKMQVVFQDPYASLDPRLTVAEIVGEPLSLHKLAKSKQERVERVEALLTSVGLEPEYMRRYPHEFSGGQRQRIGIARALAVQPSLIIADEPVSALDVSIQAQIINLLQELQKKLGLTYLFIAHDLSVVKHISNRVAVMYLGKIVEIAEKRELFSNPGHPYTRSLLSAIPIPNPDVKKERILLEGDVPSPVNPPPGCHFHPRCPHAMECCAQQAPELRQLGPEHAVACHLV